ncbi:MAG TPA: PDZ domain-containing protein [Gemmataceae bacterium]|nr:PDZ domain-containing protein [Gemmataceae bacterium]
MADAGKKATGRDGAGASKQSGRAGGHKKKPGSAAPDPKDPRPEAARVADAGQPVPRAVRDQLDECGRTARELRDQLQTLRDEIREALRELGEFRRTARETTGELKRTRAELTGVERAPESSPPRATDTRPEASEVSGSLPGSPPEGRDRLGVTVEPGVVVAEVLPDSPAAVAGITRGDLIAAVNGHPVLTGEQLRQAVHPLPARAEIVLRLTRGGETREAIARLDEPAAG